MSRRARVFTPGTLQHVSSKLLAREGLESDVERSRYLEMFGKAMQCTDWKCIAYCVTDNELQFAMIAGEQSLDSWSKRVNAAFARWINKRRHRQGPLFAGRPCSREVSAHRALALIASIHNQPARDDLVPNAAASSWTSHPAYIGLSSAPKWLDIAEGLKRAGFAQRPHVFDQAVRLLARRTVAMHDAWIVPAQPTTASYKRRRTEATRDGISGSELVEIVAEVLGLRQAALQRRHARGPEADAKRMAMHAARAIGMPLAEIARELHITRQRASQMAAMELLTNQRPDFERILEVLQLRFVRSSE